MSTAPAPDPQWVDARNAAKMLGVPGARNIHRLVRLGRIKTRDLPGVRAKYSRADVEKLAATGGGRESKPSLSYLFDLQPVPGADARLFRALGEYKAARDGHREGGDSPDDKEPSLDFGAFSFLTHLGDLALRLVNRAIDRDWNAFVAALEGSDWDKQDEGFDGMASRLWEALARLQAEGQTRPEAAAV